MALAFGVSATFSLHTALTCTEKLAAVSLSVVCIENLDFRHLEMQLPSP
jgi:hypothetical protein